MSNWKSPTEESPSNFQRVLICREDFFIILGQYVNGLYHDTRYNREESKSVIKGKFYWMELPSTEMLRDQQ